LDSTIQMPHILTLYRFDFHRRDWNPNTYLIQPNSTACIVWYKQKLKLKLPRHHPVVPMDFSGLQGNECQTITA